MHCKSTERDVFVIAVSTLFLTPLPAVITEATSRVSYTLVIVSLLHQPTPTFMFLVASSRELEMDIHDLRRRGVDEKYLGRQDIVSQCIPECFRYLACWSACMSSCY